MVIDFRHNCDEGVLWKGTSVKKGLRTPSKKHTNEGLLSNNPSSTVLRAIMCDRVSMMRCTPLYSCVCVDVGAERTPVYKHTLCGMDGFPSWYSNSD